jgi:hypothetical protein
LQQIEGYKANLSDLRGQITQLFTDLDVQTQMSSDFRHQKDAYKQKVRAANERFRALMDTID